MKYVRRLVLRKDLRNALAISEITWRETEIRQLREGDRAAL
jgi:hypothetical protein